MSNYNYACNDSIRPTNEAYNFEDDLKNVTRDEFEDLIMGDSEFQQNQQKKRMEQ